MLSKDGLRPIRADDDVGVSGLRLGPHADAELVSIHLRHRRRLETLDSKLHRQACQHFLEHVSVENEPRHTDPPDLLAIEEEGRRISLSRKSAQGAKEREEFKSFQKREDDKAQGPGFSTLASALKDALERKDE